MSTPEPGEAPDAPGTARDAPGTAGAEAGRAGAGRAARHGGGSANPARDERLLLCDALDLAGPDAPTKCAGWTAADLAAHLVVRETRPDAAPGILLPPLAFYTERVRRRAARSVPFGRLVERIRQGPPKFSPTRLRSWTKTPTRLSSLFTMRTSGARVRTGSPGTCRRRLRNCCGDG
ncbi:maleylpyruvate isomerase family mycothiol-dependent enzyme [Actinomadura sp. J1-007]|uniref:maleylpyruvate isomerase family mycothiol-dependent enzyme n=1 Tax=Actinomadura sp. J1-007 TaxID=2661913 RepID=UPI0019D55E41|nr:maleylpyruvate isomerase family mycothiol-dependent enzyme [Actinomadura sp. J1-007]